MTDATTDTGVHGAMPAAAQEPRRRRFEPLTPGNMPVDFSISLEALRRGGTDAFLDAAPTHAPRQPMRGFDPDFRNIVDYILRITHRIWEEKNIGYIYDSYSHDCRVWDDIGLQYGREKIVADTVHTNNAFPDIRLVADEVIWAGDEDIGFHTSHRTMILGTNTGFSRFGAPTGRPVRLLCIANCVARANEIYDEHVAYDTAGMIRQLGLDVVETARAVMADRADGPFAPNFAASEGQARAGQGKPAAPRIPAPEEDMRAFAEGVIGRIWNRRDLAAMDDVYAPGIVFEGSTGRVYRGVGQVRAHILSMLAMFPNLTLGVDDLYWMGNAEDGHLVSLRWGGVGAHRGNGPYGPPTGREAHVWGITQWLIRDGRIQREWTVFNEFGILMQLLG